MNVSELQTGDILWLYNFKEECYAEFEFIQQNDNDTCRFRVTGERSVDEPEYGYGIDTLEFRAKYLPDGSEKIEVISTKGFKFKWLTVKEYFGRLCRGIINGLD